MCFSSANLTEKRMVIIAQIKQSNAQIFENLKIKSSRCKRKIDAFESLKEKPWRKSNFECDVKKLLQWYWWVTGWRRGALSVLKFIWLYQMYSVSSSSILSAPPCIVNNNDRYKMKAPLILVYFLWKRKPRTQIWKIQDFYEFIGLSWGALLYF